MSCACWDGTPGGPLTAAQADAAIGRYRRAELLGGQYTRHLQCCPSRCPNCGELAGELGHRVQLGPIAIWSCDPDVVKRFHARLAAFGLRPRGVDATSQIGNWK